MAGPARAHRRVIVYTDALWHSRPATVATRDSSGESLLPVVSRNARGRSELRRKELQCNAVHQLCSAGVVFTC